MRYSIYLVTCLSTRQQYVGMTGKDVGLRWAHHVISAYAKTSGRSSPLLVAAIREHGALMFTVEMLQQTLCLEKALMLEARYAVELKTLAPEGLNLSAGAHRVTSTEFDHISKVNKRGRNGFVSGMAAQWSDPIKAERTRERMRAAWVHRRKRQEMIQ